MMYIWSFLLLSVVSTIHCSSVPEDLKNLARKWAPLVYLSEGEMFRPSTVPFFFANTKIESEPLTPLTVSTIPKCGPDCFLVTKDELLSPVAILPFFAGQSLYKAPVYSVIKQIGSTMVIYYWFFSPYNLGKVVCTNFFDANGKCLGDEQRLGNHVGDWEHIEVKFMDNKPVSIYLAYHSFGNKFLYNGCDFVNANGQPNLKFYGTHPIIFSAFGSHGSWSSEGIHPYLTLPNNQTLTDETSKGESWYTWYNLVIGMFDPTHCYDSSPVGFFRYQGRWGNRKSGCVVLAGMEACVLSSAPFSPRMEKDG